MTQKITIILLDNSGQEIDSMNYDKNSIVVAGQSLERKALQSGDCVSSQLKGEFLGNGCDTDDEGDFEIRLAPNPQNSDSVAEPRPTPVHIINGLDYPGIQWAIDIAVAGDEIQVDSGEYAEEIVIDKGIILRGVDTGSGKPIIKEVGSANNITITADGVTIDGFHITGSSNDGITTYYWSDDETANKSSDNTIINNTIAVGSDGIYLYKSHNNKIIGNDISNSDTGMYIDHSDGNIVSDNVMSFNKADGVVFYLAHNNIFSGNIVESNGNQGIEIIKADNNIINKNIIASNSEGIILWNSSDNIVTENMISLNESGIFSFDLSSNKIYHNNFIDNNYQAQSSDYSGVEFFWDNDYPSGGNFWSDYIGVNINSGTSQDEPGGDGIGDTPHILLNFIGKEMIRDRYPLMEEYKAP
ncbi:right-handed parallel beta-helix repeat-containing protein [Patescibacteria group bacterium]|nr:right-handed parallel beta-helix repeat-containing protein [Patescibacteria group bacterium]